MSTRKDKINLVDCFSGSLGKDLLGLERLIIDGMISDVFGFNAVQIGSPEYDFLANSRIPNKFVMSEVSSSQIRGLPHQNPIKSNSIDLVVLPHGLDFSINPHSVVSEIERILVPGGSLVLSAFNPVSFWGARHFLRKYMFKKNSTPPDLLSLWRVKDWLKLLSIEIEAGRWGFYRPPIQSEKWRKHFLFLESAGDRWWPIFGGIYILKGVKKVRGMRLSIDRWSSYRSVRPAVRSTHKEMAKVIELCVADE
ncbi:MAG: methyltransferase domain-containing protein [Proteobacteria bacterium]|nr:methyltransferase domain-containing protein [Pseudomonadota bacterium]